jgi:RNA-directed DNA polymerase
MLRNLKECDVYTRRRRIASLAEANPEMGFTSLHHLIDLDWLVEAWHKTRKSGSPGVDGQTADQYEKNLMQNLQNLLDRFRSGRYKAPPVLRKHIPKGSGTETRPIGIPTLEDKILQRAIVMLIEPIYEQDFYDGSYGFRPRRGAHDALQDVRETIKRFGGGWVLEVDLRKFFDTLNHVHLRELVQHRVRDGVVRRHIGKWLKAGVMEDGNISRPDSGSPQGGVISPLLSNVYLHYVLDLWFEQDVRPRMRGRVKLIRYADDFVIVFADHKDAVRVMEVLPKRFSRFDLTVHPDKTRLIDFRHPQHVSRRGSGGSQVGTFDLLGFTIYWGKSYNGVPVVRTKTMSSRVTRAIRNIAQWCRQNRHRPIHEQWVKLCQKVRGHYAYYGVPGNHRSMRNFLEHVTRGWQKWLARRNRKRRMPWERFSRLLKRYPLPRPKTLARYSHET